MSKKFLSLFLTLVTLLAAAPVRGQAVEELTDDEEREARELARQFIGRMRETRDVGPLVADLFVPDFAEHLRNERILIPMNFVAPEVARHAGDEELRGFYVKTFNFLTLMLAYLMTAPDLDKEHDSGEPWTLDQTYPPEVVRVLRSDPYIAAIVAKEEAKEAREASGEPAPEGDEEEMDDRFVKDLATLRTVTATASKASEALRPYVSSYTEIRRAREEKERAEAEEGAPPREVEEVRTPFVERKECSELGLPEGTRVIEIQIEPAADLLFELHMIRVEGRLKILYAETAFRD